jgi:hypothetical protein
MSASGKGAPALRQMLLTAKPADFGLSPTEDLPHVWAAMMEWQQNGVRAANRKFLKHVDGTLGMFVPLEHPLDVPNGAVTFTVLSYDGMRGACDEENKVAKGRSPLSPAFASVHDVISEMRKIQAQPR